MKQINLSLAKSGDIAVLRNETQRDIIEVSDNRFAPFPIRVLFEGVDFHATYRNEGYFCQTVLSDLDILDILREGVSIFEPK